MLSQYEELPEWYHGPNGRTTEPTYEALGKLHMVMHSEETGQSGPCIIEEGEHFTSHAIPGHAWGPLNKAAGEQMEAWLASLPGKEHSSLSMDDISEAAYAMRPKEGDPAISHDLWWPAVLKYAAAMRDQRRGGLQVPKPAVAHRPGREMPVMPFSGENQNQNFEYGRAPTQRDVATHQPLSPELIAQRARRQRVTPPMPGTLPQESPQAMKG